MVKIKYNFSDVYYADLDNPTKEIKLIKNCLFTQDNLYYIFIKKDDDDKNILEITCHQDIKDIKKYIFIKSDLAGVGIDGFIVETDDSFIINKLNTFFSNMPTKEYYKDNWIDSLLNYDIKRIYKTDCDGDVLFIYEKEKTND